MVPSSAPAVAPPSLVWSTAYIFYGPGDPTGLLFGEGSSMVVDDALQNTTTFGGLGTEGLSNITLVYNNGTTGYWWYATSPITPSARNNFSFAADTARGQAILFGGLTRTAPRIVANDTWAYGVANETWRNVSGGLAPPARENAAFAVDTADGIALLQGGIDPDYTVGGSGGLVLWNDTWLLNLTTWAWTPLALGQSPPPAYGASMVWDPVLGAFVRFGGCDESRCTSALWSYTPGASRWSSLVPAGSTPSPRGSAAWVWDPVDRGTLLFGGLVPGPAGPEPLGGTFFLAGDGSSWSALSGVGEPADSYGVASAFSNYTGCTGMWVQGGSPALDGTIYNVSLLEPVGAVPPNCFTPIGGSTGGGPPERCTNTSAHVTVRVRDALSRLPLAGADVDVAGTCGANHGVTDASGYLNLTEAAPDVLLVSATRVGYHPNSITITYTGRPGDFVELDLDPLPSLHAHVDAVTLLGTSSLFGAAVAIDSGVVAGTTDDHGWVNVSTITAIGTVAEIEAYAPGFSSETLTITVPYAGVVYANFTLDAYGELEVHVRDALSGFGIAGANVSLAFTDPVGANVSVVHTDLYGWFNETVEAGNYSASVTAPGYLPNATAAPVYHGWIDPTPIPVDLLPAYGADVSVHLYDRRTGASIPNGLVTFGGRSPIVGNPAGWANATNLEPAGLLAINARASGYYPNSTTVRIAPYVVLRDVELPMTPAPPCSPYAPCPPANSSGPPPLFAFLPPSGPERTLLLLAPFALAVAAGGIWMLRTRWVATRGAGPPLAAAGAGRRGF